MTERLGIDYAWQHPSPAAIVAAGYTDVLRYLSPDASKNLSPAERDQLHAHGLRIHLVWESAASRAAQGYAAGVADAHEANRQADALGHPKTEPIFYAVDFDATPAQVRAYFRGIHAAGGRTPGDYGGIRITEAGLTSLHWQTCAWSGGKVSGHAHIYQRQHATRKIAGTSGGFDENVIIDKLDGWGPHTPAPAPPVRKPPVHNHVTRGRALIHQGLAELAKVPTSRVAVKTMAAAVRAALRVGPKS